MKNSFLLQILSLCLIYSSYAQTTINQIPFGGRPLFVEKINEKDFFTIKNGTGNTVILEKYGERLDKEWSASITLQKTENILAVKTIGNNIFVFIENDLQKTDMIILTVKVYESSGKLKETKILKSLSNKDHYYNHVVVSPDKNKFLIWNYTMKSKNETKGIAMQLLDPNLKMLGEMTIDFKDASETVTRLLINNSGNVFSVFIKGGKTVETARHEVSKNISTTLSISSTTKMESGKPPVLHEDKIAAAVSGEIFYVATNAQKGDNMYSLELFRCDFNINKAENISSFIISKNFLNEFVIPAREERLKNPDKLKALERYNVDKIDISSSGDILVYTENTWIESKTNTQLYNSGDLLVYAFDINGKPKWQAIVPKLQTDASASMYDQISYSASPGNKEIRIVFYTSTADLLVSNFSLTDGQKIALPKKLINPNARFFYLRAKTLWLDNDNLIIFTRSGINDNKWEMSKIQIEQ